MKLMWSTLEDERMIQNRKAGMFLASNYSVVRNRCVAIGDMSASAKCDS